MLMTTLFVAIVLTAVMGSIRALAIADTKAHRSETLQRLAVEKLNEILSTTDVTTAETQGDFSAEGYQAVTWQMRLTSSGTTDLDIVTLTASYQGASQTVTALAAIQASTTTTGSKS
jgi:hypothetical protein